MALDGHILLIDSVGGGSQPLAERMRGFGIDPVVVVDFEEAHLQLDARNLSFSAVMIPTDLPTHSLKQQIKRLRRSGPATGLIMVSSGKAPTPEERKNLRAAGLTIALWEPYDDGTLRFQLNRAISGDREHHGRKTPRAPTYLLSRIFVGERTKDAVLYSLSEGGAFLETPRASMDGARVDIEIRLPNDYVRVQGVVIFANVPGNLQRPNLPLGMGVRFDPMPDDVLQKIASYVASRLGELNV